MSQKEARAIWWGGVCLYFSILLFVFILHGALGFNFNQFDSFKYTFVFIILNHIFIKIVIRRFEVEAHPLKVYFIGALLLGLNYLYQNAYVNKYNYAYKMEDKKFNHIGPFYTAAKASTRFYLSLYGVFDLVSFKEVDKEFINYMREQLVENSLYEDMKILLDKGHIQNTCSSFQNENSPLIECAKHLMTTINDRYTFLATGSFLKIHLLNDFARICLERGSTEKFQKILDLRMANYSYKVMFETMAIDLKTLREGNILGFGYRKSETSRLTTIDRYLILREMQSMKEIVQELEKKGQDVVDEYLQDKDSSELLRFSELWYDDIAQLKIATAKYSGPIYSESESDFLEVFSKIRNEFFIYNIFSFIFDIPIKSDGKSYLSRAEQKLKENRLMKLVQSMNQW